MVKIFLHMETTAGFFLLGKHIREINLYFSKSGRIFGKDEFWIPGFLISWIPDSQFQAFSRCRISGIILVSCKWILNRSFKQKIMIENFSLVNCLLLIFLFAVQIDDSFISLRELPSDLLDSVMNCDIRNATAIISSFLDVTEF